MGKGVSAAKDHTIHERALTDRPIKAMKNHMNYPELYEHCRLCPRLCGVNRHFMRGICGETDRVRVAYIGPHFGEEPPITGANGSGTVFFSGCSLRCRFCQNRQISHDNLGRTMDVESLLVNLEEMIQSKQVHNVNFVTPDHFFPSVFEVVASMHDRGYDLPFVYNLSGYQSKEMVQAAQIHADIYLPDFKYSDRSLAERLSKCGDYPGMALEALSEMVRQKGFLDSCETGAAVATRGVLVRHLILPGAVRNSMDALTMLFLEFGPDLPLSLMSQYLPVGKDLDGALGRCVKGEEFDRVYVHAGELGFRNLFVQFPERGEDASLSGSSPFLPDFFKSQPFQGRGV